MYLCVCVCLCTPEFRYPRGPEEGAAEGWERQEWGAGNQPHLGFRWECHKPPPLHPILLCFPKGWWKTVLDFPSQFNLSLANLFVCKTLDMKCRVSHIMTMLSTSWLYPLLLFSRVQLISFLPTSSILPFLLLQFLSHPLTEGGLLGVEPPGLCTYVWANLPSTQLLISVEYPNIARPRHMRIKDTAWISAWVLLFYVLLNVILKIQLFITECWLKLQCHGEIKPSEHGPRKSCVKFLSVSEKTPKKTKMRVLWPRFLQRHGTVLGVLFHAPPG